MADVLAALGGLSIVAGVGLVSIPAALVVLGMFLIVVAWRLA